MSIEKVYVKDTKVWIPHVEKAWEKVTILEDFEIGQMQLVVQTEDSNERLILILKSNADLPPLFHPEDNLLDEKRNLTSLTVIHEASIFNALRTRFERRCVHNYCGIAMFILNPYVKISISEKDKILNYRGQSIDRLDPHIFAAAEKVYCRLERENYDQSIIFSGESGAGKTENANSTVLYLVTIAANESQVKEEILASSTVLQAFGNAKTIKNDNSSRFGKFIEIQYDKNYNIIGASLRTYLLDRSRIVCQEQWEQNFNIFYQLRSAKNRFPHLHLDEEEFNYLNQKNYSEMDEINNLTCFDKTMDALNMLGFSTKQQDEILRILAATLHLGNINFKKLEREGVKDNAESCFISGLSYLHALVKLYGLDLKAIKSMRKWLCHKRIFSQQDEILQPMTVEEAVKARNALAKFIYTKLFNWLVTRINATFRSPCNVQSFIGILDFYGFEKLDVNCFEQFCINYADEKVQQHFVLSTFKLEQEEYLREEIGWTFIRFQDNRHCIELIEGKYGIIDILDVETRISKDSNTLWVENLYSKCKKAKHFEKPEDTLSDFIICHFIDCVQYDTNEFLEKNRDTAIREQLSVLKDTKNDLLSRLIKDEYLKLALPKGKRRTSTHRRVSIITKYNKKTVISEFRNSLITLTSILSKTTPHYVKCIKTNDERKPFELNPLRVAEQLRAFNVLETVQISAAGFYNQQTYADFFQRYHCLHQFENIKRDELQEPCRTILAAYIEDISNIKFGKTKLFLRENHIKQLENLRMEKRDRASITIQKTVRRFLQQKQYRKVVFSIRGFLPHARKYLLRQELQALREELAAIKIQAYVRGWLKRKWYQRLRSEESQDTITESITNPETVQAEMQTEVMTSAATDMQRFVRGFLARRKYERKLRDIIVIQSCVRRFLAKIARDKMKKSRDERVQLLNRGLENKINLLQQKINCLMQKHLSSKALEQMLRMLDNQQCIQAKNRILNQILFNKIRTLKELRENQEKKAYELPEIESKMQDLNDDDIRIDNRHLYGVFKPLITAKEDCKLYHNLIQSYYKFDQRHEELRRMLGLESKIVQLQSLNNDAVEKECAINERLDDKNNNSGDHGMVLAEDTSAQTDPNYKQKNHYEGMLQYNVKEINTLMNHLIIDLDPLTIIQQSPDLPAQIMFMCIRYSDSLNDRITAFLLIQRYVKIIKQVVKQQKLFHITILWLANTHRLLNYLKQYSRIIEDDRDMLFHAENTARQNEQSLRNLDLTNQWVTLRETGQWLVKKAVKQMKTRTLEFVRPALLDNEEIIELDEIFLVSDQELSTSRQKFSQLIKELTSFAEIFKRCGVHRKITLQMFKQIFDFLSSIALSNIMSRRELCNSSKGTKIRCNLRYIERWASNNQLISAIEGLSPVIQAARLLQIMPLQEDAADWIAKCYTKLNYNQIMKILNSYLPVNDSEGSMSQDAIDKIQFKLVKREAFEDTILIDAENYPVSFPFQHSAICLEDIEFPAVFYLSMLKKI